MAKFLIRNLVPDDVAELISLPQTEGREMGMEPEIHTWLKVDPEGIFVAVDTESGEIVGCCSAMILSESHGYIGMYVVGKRYRGAGLGRILWQAAVSHLGDRNMCLSAVESMVQNYKDRAGFSVVADWTVDLYFCTSLCLPSSTHLHTHCLPPHTFVVDPDGPLVKLVLNYDASIQNYDRSSIVLSTLTEIGTITVLAVSFKEGFLSVKGYACIKKSLQGHWLIAPVYAEDYSCASSLIHGLIASLTPDQREEGIVAKLISRNHEAEKLFHNYGFKKSKYQLQRLFTRYPVDIPTTRIFALQSSIFCTE